MVSNPVWISIGHIQLIYKCRLGSFRLSQWSSSTNLVLLFKMNSKPKGRRTQDEVISNCPHTKCHPQISEFDQPLGSQFQNLIQFTKKDRHRLILLLPINQQTHAQVAHRQELASRKKRRKSRKAGDRPFA